MKKTAKVRPDVILKEYWRDPSRFADLFNQVLFGGQRILRPETLIDVDTDMSVSVEGKGGNLSTLERRRDVNKKTAGDIEFVLYGIENQMDVHYAMPLRCYLYDALGYVIQCKVMARDHQNKKDLKTTEEFLSGMTREDRLNIVITVTIYYGEESWDGAKSLSDMVKVDEIYKPFFQDYSMHLLEVRDMGKYSFENEEVSQLFQMLGELYGKKSKRDKKEALQQKYADRTINKEVLLAVAAASGDGSLAQRIWEEEGEMNMCTFFEELKDEGRLEGIEQGIEQGTQRVNSLIQQLIAQSRIDEIATMVQDEDHQQKLFEEFGI